MSFGRVNGMHKWRKGWRADALRADDYPRREPPATPPPDLDARARRTRRDAPRPRTRAAPAAPADGGDGPPPPPPPPHLAAAWAWWRGVCGGGGGGGGGAPRCFVLAPMIGASDLPFRALCRQHGGVRLCFTPMYEATRVVEGEFDAELGVGAPPPLEDAARERPPPQPPPPPSRGWRLGGVVDRPLAVQIAGDDVATMVAAARRVQPVADVVDVNLGCPQRCALDGHYGAANARPCARRCVYVRI